MRVTQQRQRLPRPDKCVCECVCAGECVCWGGWGGLCVSEFVRGEYMWGCVCDLDFCVWLSSLCICTCGGVGGVHLGHGVSLLVSLHKGCDFLSLCLRNLSPSSPFCPLPHPQALGT